MVGLCYEYVSESESYTVASTSDVEVSAQDDLEMDPNLVPFDPTMEGETFNLLFGEPLPFNALPEEPVVETAPEEIYTDSLRAETEHATAVLDNILNQRDTPSPDNDRMEDLFWRGDGIGTSSSSSPSSAGDYSSRFYDKLAPMLETTDHNNDRKSQSRGRQSVDEQLARMHNLPFTPQEITNWTFKELQSNVRGIDLTDVQKELIRKIRRRGKNKVAARACRKRKETLFRYTSDSENYPVCPIEESVLRQVRVT
uniref:BZIP domain-containing protein n=1 Tax=Steinernema glaseri TaxID=37863 RepID=A0A1I8APQ3_9BILA